MFLTMLLKLVYWFLDLAVFESQFKADETFLRRSLVVILCPSQLEWSPVKGERVRMTQHVIFIRITHPICFHPTLSAAR